jgi:hypothetical protein
VPPASAQPAGADPPRSLIAITPITSTKSPNSASRCAARSGARRWYYRARGSPWSAPAFLKPRKSSADAPATPAMAHDETPTVDAELSDEFPLL